MMVYKFTSAKWAKVAVRDMRLKLSIFTELNDPFELSGFNLRDPVMRAFIGRGIQGNRREKNMRTTILYMCAS